MHNFLHRIPLYIKHEEESITFYLDNSKSRRFQPMKTQILNSTNTVTQMKALLGLSTH